MFFISTLGKTRQKFECAKLTKAKSTKNFPKISNFQYLWTLQKLHKTNVPKHENQLKAKSFAYKIKYASEY